ncbi:MAG: HEAT repeat domain-containing protein, partial [Acidobacteriota bacterium]
VEALDAGPLAARLAAAEALGCIGDPRAIDPLVSSLGDLDTLDGIRGCDLRLRRNVARALGDIGKAVAVAPLRALGADRYTAGAAVEALVKILRWDGAQVADEDLVVLVGLDDPAQVPWMVDEVREATTGEVVVREGKPWPVDASDLRVHALAEQRRRDNDG